jgi:hypothetical protein
MSDRYEYCAYVVTDTVSDTHVGFASNIPNAMRLTKELNALQDVIDIAHRYYKLDQQTFPVFPPKDDPIWSNFKEAKNAFESAMQALTPKTVEQLLQERLEAADLVIQIIDDCRDERDLFAAADKYDAAKKAHEKAVQS